MSTQPAYAAAPVVGVANFNTANTNRDGTGSIAQLIVGRLPGTRIERVNIRATAATTAGMIRIYHKLSGLTLNTDGTINSFSAAQWRLIHEIPVSAITPAAAVEAFSAEWAPTNGFNLGPFEQLGVSTHNGETFNAIARGGLL